jgi:hypothetical protein
MAGDASFAFSQTGALALTIALEGDSSFSITGSSGLSLIVPLAGDAAFSVVATADLKGNLSLEGHITPFTDLSPENLASAVWSALAASNNLAGTMGEKLNDAGSASNPWTEVIESGYTAAEILRLLAAVAVGETAIGTGPTVVTFTGLDGTTDRVIANMTDSERTSVTLDAAE